MVFNICLHHACQTTVMRNVDLSPLSRRGEEGFQTEQVVWSTQSLVFPPSVLVPLPGQAPVCCRQAGLSKSRLILARISKMLLARPLEHLTRIACCTGPAFAFHLLISFSSLFAFGPSTKWRYSVDYHRQTRSDYVQYQGLNLEQRYGQSARLNVLWR